MYIYWHWQKFFETEQINEIVNFCEQNYDDVEDKTKGAKDYNNNYKKSATVKYFYWKKIKHLLGDMYDAVIDCNYHNFGFDLNNLTDSIAVNYNNRPPRTMHKKNMSGQRRLAQIADQE